MIITTEPIQWGNGQGDIQNIPKIIWIFWEGNSSPLVDICITQIYKLLPDYQVNILSFKNLKDFLPDIIDYKESLPFANYSDVIRLELLKNFGGIWLDASSLLTENLDWVFQLKEKTNADLIGFYADSFTEDFNFPLVENYFLAVAPNNQFIIDWAEDFKQCYSSETPYQYFDEEKKNPSFCQKIDEMLSHYLIAYLSASKIMRKNPNKYKLTLLAASKTAHYYNFGLHLPPHQLSELFLFNKNNFDVPKLIKFEKKGRTSIDTIINRGQYRKTSMLYKLTQNKTYLYQPKLMINYVKYIINNILKNKH